MGKQIEYVLWGTKNNIEDIIRVNGQEVQTDYKLVLKMKKIIEDKKEFSKVRIQRIDYKNQNIKELFIKGVK